MLETLLETNQAALRALVRSEACGLLRFETAEDLLQGICEHVLGKAAHFSYDDDASARAWLRRVARNYLADRCDHWGALRRGGGRVLRLTASTGAGPTGAARVPAAAQTGPRTFAERRELLLLATKTLATLPDRDRQLVVWASEGVPLAAQAERLGVSYVAAQRAAHRAVARFRQAFELLERRKP